MPDFLTFNGTPVPILRDGASQRPSVKIGDSARAYDGTLRSTVRGKKRGWAVKTGPLLPAEEDTFREMVDTDDEITVNGDAVNNTPIQCRVDMGETEYISDGTVDGFLRLANFEIKEI